MSARSTVFSAARNKVFGVAFLVLLLLFVYVFGVAALVLIFLAIFNT